VTIALFLYVLALVLFFLTTIGVPGAPRFNLLAAGLFCWLAANLLSGAKP